MPYREIITGQVDKALSKFLGNDSANAPVMLMLGGFKFSLNTAVFQDMQRSSSYRWPAQERVGQFDAKQFTGPGDDRITLPGVIYPDFRGGNAQVDDLRKIAAQGKTVKLIAASGDILGAWVIENIEDTRTFFKPDGSFRKQDFTVTIARFGNDAAV